MGKSKYRNHEEFGANAPINWREKTTSESLAHSSLCREQASPQSIAPTH